MAEETVGHGDGAYERPAPYSDSHRGALPTRAGLRAKKYGRMNATAPRRMAVIPVMNQFPLAMPAAATAVSTREGSPLQDSAIDEEEMGASMIDPDPEQGGHQYGHRENIGGDHRQ